MKIEISQLSWNAAFALAEFAMKEAERLSKESSRPLEFTPVNERGVAYFKHVKARQVSDSAALYRFAKEVMNAPGPSACDTFEEPLTVLTGA